MDIPSPPQAVAALAAFVRARLGDVSGTVNTALAPLLRGPDRHPALAVDAARQFATAVVGAAAPFAPTSYSRARLIRQMHASGLLSDEQARITHDALREHDAAGGGATT